ncbi:hypothetical protein LGT39_12400 [Demequina sp. TTPB684]|uniref:hypothetical protein n=1 Tax=unclassified Demequina TaxID=2620311 RepID=UPI001CF2C2D0|nr:MULTISPECIES: hypothetical protein [unclassified Demequina]MCB2413645.1 hypothetical protein [Demequina sp. TTPB684]UPU87708.1 hypothetical protein LGT36_010655 [Demequina sp. TMPB413]
MSVTVSASELTGGSPPFAQVVVSGMADGDVYTVVGAAGDHEWPVQGGQGTSDGTQLVLVDSRVPWGGSVVYKVTIGLDVYEAAPFSIEYSGAVCVFQSLSGDKIVPVDVATFTDPKSFRTRRAFFQVTGRRGVVVRHDVTSLPEKPLVVETDTAAGTSALESLLSSGAPIVRRQQIGLRDLAPVEVISVGDFDHELVGAVGDLRVWSLPHQVIDEPEPGTVLFIFEWDDFDTVYAAATWADFDTEWAPFDWDRFDREDWGARL